MIRRVLVAPINADHPQRGLEAAFRGVFGADNVDVFDYLDHHRSSGSADAVNEALLERSAAHQPDWVWLQIQDTGVIQPATLRRLREALPGTVVTHWTGDMRPSVSAYMADVCNATHMTLASSTGQLDAFVRAGAPVAYYCQIGVDFEEDMLGLPDWEPPFRVPDVVLCANYYGHAFKESELRRSAILALQAAGVDVGIVGGGWPARLPTLGVCGVKQQHHVWRRAQVALNVNHFNGVAGYYSDRQLIAMGSGTPLVCRYVPGLEDEFEDGTHCFFYRDDHELVDRVRRLIDDPDLRARVGRAGRDQIIRCHTWFDRILSILPLIEAQQEALA
jgi:hypothetical protein